MVEELAHGLDAFACVPPQLRGRVAEEVDARLLEPGGSQVAPKAVVEGRAGRASSLSSRSDEIVLDLFLGPDSTLIAAERLGRRCFGLELDPRHVDVAVRRWEEFTGKTAERIPATTLGAESVNEIEARLSAMGLGKVVLA